MLNVTVLREKGWSEEEIAHAKKVFQEAEFAKKPILKKLEIAVFWVLLTVIVAGVFAISMVLVPILLYLDSLMIAIILGMLGMCFGAFYNIVVRDIEWLEKLHHTASILVLMAIASANVWLITAMMNKFTTEFAIGQVHEPLPLAIVFAVALVTPFFHHLLSDWWKGPSVHVEW